MTFDDTHCAVCGKRIDANFDDVRFQSDGALVHTYPCGEVRVFVYGTLRSGSWLAARITRAWREQARIDGYALRYSQYHRSFPYMVEAEGQTTHGELLTILTDDEHGMREVKAVTAMEENAGYETRPVKVRIKAGTVDAIAYVSTRELGEQVPDNDWTRDPDWRVRYDPDPDEDVSTEWEDDGVPYVIHSGGRPFVKVTHGDAVVWEGSSYTALGRWAKEHGITLSKPE